MQYDELRDKMVRSQLEARDVTDPRVLAAMRRVPRHEFVPEALRDHAYEDRPLPIGHGQTISQPYVVALMTQLALGPEARRALDVGSGSGYQAAVLAEIVEEVVSIEVVPELAESARARLAELGYTNVEVRCADGYVGLPETEAFDALVVACAARDVPEALLDRLAVGGNLVMPVGVALQDLVLIQKRHGGKLRRSRLGPVAFVPMVEGH